MPEGIVVDAPQVAVAVASKAPAAPARRFEIPEGAIKDVAAPAPAASETKAPTAPAVQNTGEQATPATPEAKPENEEVTPEQAAKREGRRFERKLDKAYRERAEARAEAELLKKQLSEIRQPQAAKAPEGKPTLEQFDYDPEKYATATAEFEKSKALKEHDDKQRKEVGEQARAKLLTDWEERVSALEDSDEEVDPRVAQIRPDTPLTIAIMESDIGAKIANYLLKNPKDDQRIGKLSPLSQAREIGKLEAKLLTDPVKPKTPSKAPAPINTLSGTAPVGNDAPSNDDDTATWIKKRQKQVHGKR